MARTAFDFQLEGSTAPSPYVRQADQPLSPSFSPNQIEPGRIMEPVNCSSSSAQKLHKSDVERGWVGHAGERGMGTGRFHRAKSPDAKYVEWREN